MTNTKHAMRDIQGTIDKYIKDRIEQELASFKKKRKTLKKTTTCKKRSVMDLPVLRSIGSDGFFIPDFIEVIGNQYVYDSVVRYCIAHDEAPAYRIKVKGRWKIVVKFSEFRSWLEKYPNVLIGEHLNK